MTGGDWPEPGGRPPSLRFLVYWSLRREELCPGERECPEAVEVACLDCGAEWTPADFDIPGPCPSCGGERWQRLRCRDCRLTALETYERSPAGQLLQRALDVKTAIQIGAGVTLDDIHWDEFQALQVIEEERSRWEREQEARRPR